MILAVDVPREVFQSTHPARGATERGRALSVAVGISIHAPREGCDPRMVRSASQLSLFQSTHPAWGATYILPLFAGYNNISIHAPREGCDGTPPGSSSGRSDFNPRTPRGVRLTWKPRLPPISIFQSTHPARGATIDWECCVPKILFQSTHPARGATPWRSARSWTSFYFNPRTPRGVRRMTPTPPLSMRSDFNPRTPRGVRLHDALQVPKVAFYFNPRTPRGVRQQTLPKSREFAWLNLLICTRGRRLSIQKQTRLCSIKLSFMLFGCEPAGEGVSSWTSHATKSKVRLEGRSA